MQVTTVAHAPEARRDLLARTGGRLGSISPQALAGALFLVLVVSILAAILSATDGHLIYSLDDPYIHLALAERIALGHYGINLGEVTSPSSSVIWPFLLLPGSGTPIHAFAPLAINVACGFGTALLFGRFAADLPLPGSEPTRHAMQLAVAALLVIAGNTVGLAFTGMEHNLQVLLAVAAAIGLIAAWDGREMPRWAIAAAVLGPAIRYEMLAITLAVVITLAAQRHWRKAGVLLLASLLLPALLSLYLVAQGNLPLPNSVIAKLRMADPETSFISRILTHITLGDLGPKVSMWLMLAVLVSGVSAVAGVRKAIFGGVALAAVLHFVLGRFGWFYRYEMYALAFCGLVTLRAVVEIWPQQIRAAGAMLVVCAGLFIAPLWLTPGAALNIYEQQAQMGRFVQQHYKKPFAVNDLGLVSFKLVPSIYVLDLYGLASNEAVRQRHKDAAWLDQVTRRHGAGLAIIYDEWFDDAPASWTPIARMTLASPRITPASDHVTFYATAVGDAGEIRRELEAFQPSLPRGVRLDFADGNKR